MSTGYVGPGGQWVEKPDTPNQGGVSGAGKWLGSAAPAAWLTTPPLLPAPAYPGNSVAVGAWQCYTANGNTYICCTSGTTAASGSGPTGTGSLPIADGTAAWLYEGPAPVAGSNPPTVTINTTNPAVGGTLPRYYRPAGTSYNVGQASTVTSDDWFVQSGGVMLRQTIGISWDTANSSVGPYEISFMLDDDRFCVVIPQTSFAGCMILVDGVLIGPGRYSNGNSGGYTFITVQLPDARDRKITLLGSFTTPLGGVLVRQSASLWAPPITLTNSMALEGDSYSAGSNYGWFRDIDVPHYRMARALGFEQWWINAKGGTGYLTAGSDTTFINRISRIPAGQKMIAVMGGINDPLTGLQAAVTAYLVALRAAQPAAYIAVGGVFCATSGPDATSLSKEAAVQAAVAAVNDPKIKFFPISSALVPWFFGTGTATSPASNGNTDRFIGGIASDTTHPIPPGTRHMAYRAAQSIAALA